MKEEFANAVSSEGLIISITTTKKSMLTLPLQYLENENNDNTVGHIGTLLGVFSEHAIRRITFEVTKMGLN